jgi:hypothetical protein
MLVYFTLHISSILAGGQWLTPVILATQKAEIRRTKVQGQHGQKEKKKKQDSISKIPNTACRVAQVVACLPSKHEALSSTPPQNKASSKKRSVIIMLQTEF